MDIFDIAQNWVWSSSLNDWSIWRRLRGHSKFDCVDHLTHSWVTAMHKITSALCRKFLTKIFYRDFWIGCTRLYRDIEISRDFCRVIYRSCKPSFNVHCIGQRLIKNSWHSRIRVSPNLLCVTYVVRTRFLCMHIVLLWSHYVWTFKGTLSIISGPFDAFSSVRSIERSVCMGMS